MKTISSLISLIVTAIFSIAAAAQDYEVPRTQWGQPDLQGVWNWSSNVPMQRPTRFGDRQFLTAEEVEEAARRRAAADANSDAALPIEGVDGSYNEPKQSPFDNFFDPFGDPFDNFFDRNNEEFYEVEADAFLNLSTDKKSVYVGEGFNTTLSFFVSENNVADMRFYELGKQLTEIIKQIIIIIIRYNSGI